MNKKGTSLVELIAVIVIMGIISSIGAVTVVSIIARQRKNATISSLKNIYETAKGLLVQVEAGSYDENIVFIDDDFCYISLTSMIDNGAVDGEKYRPTGNEVYFCYDMHEPFVIITNETINKVKPESTGSTTINQVLVTYSYSKDSFIIA